MKPPAFDYHAPRTVDETLGLLAAHGEDAKLLAGGQSLGPLLNLRLAAPAVLIDINRILDLAGQRVDGDGALRLGAMVRQRAIERSPVVRERCGLLSEAVGWVGHPTIRNRGTLGGSLAHADPAAELPAVALALGASMVIRGAETRVVDSEAFFRSVLTTCLGPDEMLVEVRFPAEPPGRGAAWVEFAPRHGDYAIAGVAAVVSLAADGTYGRVRLALAGVAEVPRLSPDAARLLEGAVPSARGWDAAAERAVADLAPPSDAIASAGYRRHLARVLTRRALARATERARRVPA